MRKIFLLFIVYFLLFVNNVHAAPIITETPEQSPAEAQINKLKDRIASRVAELKLVERRGIIGTTTEVSDTHITVADIQNNTRFIDVDELTKFSSPASKISFGISDITKGEKLGILGLYNKQSRRLLARFVDIIVLPKTLYGAVKSADNETFTIKVITENKEEVLVDVQTTTRTMSYTKDGGQIRSGFSKIKEGQRIIVVGFEDIKDKSRFIPLRIILFPDIPKNPNIFLPATPATTVPSEATSSGKKVSP